MNLYTQMGLDKIALDSNRRKHTLPRHAVRIVLKEMNPELTYEDIAEMEGSVAGRAINHSTVIYSGHQLTKIFAQLAYTRSIEILDTIGSI